MCSIIKCLWVLHFIIYLFRSPSWQCSVLKFVRCSPTHQRPRNEYQLAGQQSSLPGHSLDHIWLKGPPVVSPSSCSIPWHRGITCLCCFRNIHHLTPCYAVRISKRSFRLGISDSLPEVTRVFPLHVRGQGTDMTLVLGNRPSLSFLAG